MINIPLIVPDRLYNTNEETVECLLSIYQDSRTITNTYGFSDSSGKYIGFINRPVAKSCIKLGLLFKSNSQGAITATVCKLLNGKGTTWYGFAIEIAKVGDSWESRWCNRTGYNTYEPTLPYSSSPTYRYRIIIDFPATAYNDVTYESWGNKSITVRQSFGFSFQESSGTISDVSLIIDPADGVTFRPATTGSWVNNNTINFKCIDVNNNQSITFEKFMEVVGHLVAVDIKLSGEFIKW